MVPVVGRELIDDRAEWREMTTHVRTVATQAFQIWLRPDERALGWRPTRASRSALTSARSIPGHRCRRRCGPRTGPTTTARARSATSAAASTRAWPTPMTARRLRQTTARHASARPCCDTWTATSASTARMRSPRTGSHGNCCAASNGERGDSALATQHVSVNIDPSDRYVQSVPGSDDTACGPTKVVTTTWFSRATGPTAV